MGDAWKAADALQNARDCLIIARSSRGLQRDRDIKRAIENVRDAMELLGMTKDVAYNVD